MLRTIIGCVSLLTMTAGSAFAQRPAPTDAKTAFGVERGVYYVPGLDAYLRFRIAADGRVALFWDSVLIVEPAVPRKRAPSR